MKKILTSIVALLVTINMAAVPAKPVKSTITLANGTKVSAILRGDEHFHYYVASDGRAIMQQADGTFQYTDQQTISKQWAERRFIRNAARLTTDQRRRAFGKAPRKEFGVPGSVVGEKRGIVILVNFTDKRMSHTQQEFDNQFNKEGYNVNRHVGSVRDYFRAQSYGQLTIDFDVVGPYNLSNNMSYYGGNDSYGNDKNPDAMIVEAVKAADKEVDFSKYDWDGDGYVDQVYVIYAGFGEAQSSISNTIWPHEYELSATNKALKLDGVWIDTYACSNELTGSSGTQLDGIGTACHEFTHCLGIPDMYDIDYKNFGMGPWDLMDSGAYNGPDGYDGCVPAAYTAYERWFSGWLKPTELNEGCVVKDMAPITEQPECYIIYNQANRNEYYLLQNIQQKSWNSCAFGHGLIVQHVYYNKNIWQYNEVNCTSGSSGNKFQRCTIIPADGSLQMDSYYGSYYVNYNGLPGDPFPGTGKVTELTDTSKPAASLYENNGDGRKFLGKPITNITEQNGLISFVFNGGISIETPEAYEVSEEDKGTTSFTARWSEVEDAASYTLELRKITPRDPSEGGLVMHEDFSGFASMTNGNSDISEYLDRYTKISGWQGTKVYSGYGSGGKGGVKLASAKATGSLTTPQFDTPQTGMVTVTMNVLKYGTDNMGLTLSVVGESGEYGSTTITSEGTAYLAVEVSGPYSIQINTPAKQRVYITDLKIADGEYEAAEMDELEEDSSAPRRIAGKVVALITDITAPQYELTDLEAAEYLFRVQAVDNNGNNSEWSNTVSVVLETETSIESLTTDRFLMNNSEVIYDLQGRRVSAPTKGIFIIGGKKVVR